MSVNILGISAFYHDSAACLLKDGEIIACAQEERFSRRKHDFDFPKQAIDYCLKEGRITIEDLDYVAFYDKPFIKFERIIETYLSYAPRGIRSFLIAMPLWLKKKLLIKQYIYKQLPAYKGKIIFPEHHESHAASAFYPSPFKEAAFLTVDGVGEWATASFGIGKDNFIELQYELHFPHSLGLLYSAFTYYTGFKVNSGEYKLMGLAPYGEPKYVSLIYKYLLDLKEDGSFKLNMKYFNYCSGLTMTNNRFHKLFGAPRRKPDSELSQLYMDVAASIQKVTEEIIFRMARQVKKVTGQTNLCLAGGVALNCVANGKLLQSGLFKDLWVQPAASDAGGALGAALIVWHQYLENERKIIEGKDGQKASLLGPEFSDKEIEAFLDKSGAVYRKYRSEEIFELVAEWLTKEKVIGWFQGRMEFGPRALGNRSILGDARSPRMQRKINLKIKFRESFRPFAPSVLEEESSQWFALTTKSPYMLLVSQVKKEKQREPSSDQKQLGGLTKLNVVRSEIPAVTHVDYSARIQTVNREDNALYHNLIKEFRQKTGCPVIINTSFNVRGEPIVCTPKDAYECFMKTEMDYLVLGNFILNKRKQVNDGKRKK